MNWFTPEKGKSKEKALTLTLMHFIIQNDLFTGIKVVP